MLETNLVYDTETEENIIAHINNVHHVYQTGTYALKGVSLQIPKG